ncbi:hypothetical protein GCWU000325_02448 [Alloprevotella tannerae ATCC 51259]|uniref:Uncharacterized protein n=1 Tax=Alloprevotella tannerae ATCC 51259 TaxID=626522 RepID=C9LJN5_9BACT|nr:hypothetical protein GCWU000325_02448 [Alloprevotella tannerae ATCC 51259]
MSIQEQWRVGPECSLFMPGFDGYPAQGRGRRRFSIAEKRLTLQADEIC